MATYDPGRWYDISTEREFKAFREWCKTNKKPFFALKTNEKHSGDTWDCGWCKHFYKSCLSKSKFTDWMQTSRMYYCKGLISGFANQMSEDVGTSYGEYPFGYVYKNSKEYDYFCRPVSDDNGTAKNPTGLKKVYINTPDRLIDFLKQYEFSELVTVTFKDWNGSILSTQQIEKGKSATPPADPSRQGYIFTGWDGSYTNVQSNTTITAQYKQVQPETAQGKLIIDTYCFGAKHDVTFECSDSKLLYYLYPENQLVDTLDTKISFDANGATNGIQSDILVSIRRSWTCPSPTISRTNYIFTAWNTRRDGTGITYVPGTSYPAPTKVLTLYAQWTVTKKIYAVIATYDGNTDNKNKYDWGLSDADTISQTLNSAYGDRIVIKKLVQTDKPTANNVLDSIESYMNETSCQLLFIYLAAHGNRSNSRSRMLYSGNTYIYGDKLFNKLKNATCKIHLIVHACHAAQFVKAFNPSAVNISNNGDTLEKIEGKNVNFDDEIYNMPADFISDAKRVFATSTNIETKPLLRSATVASADPCMLVWTCCAGDEYGWSCCTDEKTKDPTWFAAMHNKIGSGLGLSFVDQFNKNITYSKFWNNMTADGQYCRLNQSYHTSLPTTYPTSIYGKGPTPQQAVFGNFDTNAIVFN